MVALCAAVLGGAGPLAAADVSGRVTVGSAQMFRGLKETRDGMAVSALLQYESGRGPYVALWAGRAEFPRSQEGSDAEVDYIVGYGRALGERLTFDTSLVHYTYPTSSLGYDWTEWNASLRWDDCCTLTAGVGSDWRGRDEATSMLELTYRHPLWFGLVADATVGLHDVSRARWRDYRYYELGVGYAFDRVQARVARVSTDSAGRQSFISASRGRWVGTLSLLF